MKFFLTAFKWILHHICSFPNFSDNSNRNCVRGKGWQESCNIMWSTPTLYSFVKIAIVLRKPRDFTIELKLKRIRSVVAGNLTALQYLKSPTHDLRLCLKAQNGPVGSRRRLRTELNFPPQLTFGIPARNSGINLLFNNYSVGQTKLPAAFSRGSGSEKNHVFLIFVVRSPLRPTPLLPTPLLPGGICIGGSLIKRFSRQTNEKTKKIDDGNFSCPTLYMHTSGATSAKCSCFACGIDHRHVGCLEVYFRDALVRTQDVNPTVVQ